MDVNAIRLAAMSAFPVEGTPTSIVSDIGKETLDGADVLEALAGKPWPQVGSIASEHGRFVSALEVDAFRYYLPAFLIAAADDPASEAATFLVYALAPLANLKGFFEGTCGLFTPRQSELIATFLEQIADEPSAEPLLDAIGQAVTLWRLRADA